MAQDRIIDLHRRHRVARRRSLDREQQRAASPGDKSSLELAAQLRDPELTPAAATLRKELHERFQHILSYGHWAYYRSQWPRSYSLHYRSLPSIHAERLEKIAEVKADAMSPALFYSLSIGGGATLVVTGVIWTRKRRKTSATSSW